MLRSTKRQDRLNHLVLLHVHNKEHTDDLNLKAVANLFQHRRIDCVYFKIHSYNDVTSVVMHGEGMGVGWWGWGGGGIII